MECKYLTIKLLTGNVMPLIALGTYRIRGNDTIYRVLDYALEAGYRSFDTAAVYGNETSIGLALKSLLPKYNLKREDIFLTTKLSPRDHGANVYKAVEKSLEYLGTDYIDLYLIHWPGVEGISVKSEENETFRLQSWHALSNLHKKGVLKAIGVSNFTVKHLDSLIKNCDGIKPAVNQVEWHPHFHEDDLLEFCRKENIVLQAYSPLGSTSIKDLLRDLIVNGIAKKLNCSVAQLLLRWSIQQNIPVAVKATSKEHIDQNLLLNFVIPEDDMKTLSNLKIKEKYAWDPTVVQ